ncbi:alpha/beta hydrolase [Catenulispora sp. NF23]|uniref:alpha/beta fold hydrolase n=1 Tax=Catenulispora pinistramenti TaxID=2705254 RepID=UPI001BA4A448|nr:alpha/beta hydrolase [Catenulispora pinistramenti]MBS2539208.1 alpha/beta hydrolase [Catenulispora pinistramenti]
MTVSEFKNAEAADRFHGVYEELLAKLWPGSRTMLDVPTRFGTTRVVRTGPGAGTGTGARDPIVLLPASGGNALMWHRYVEALSREHAVYAVDTVGEPGGSVQTTPIADGRDAAAWLEELLVGLGATNAHIVGCSYGGWIALKHQIHHPGRAAALTLVDPAGFAEVGWRFYRWVIVGGLAGLAPRPLRPRLARAVHNSAILDSDLMTLMRASMGFRRRLPKTDVLTDEDLQALQVPAQFLLGARSAIHHSDQVAERLGETLPTARVEVIPGTGHALSTDEPELVTDRILKWSPPQNRTEPSHHKDDSQGADDPPLAALG